MTDPSLDANGAGQPSPAVDAGGPPPMLTAQVESSLVEPEEPATPDAGTAGMPSEDAIDAGPVPPVLLVEIEAIDPGDSGPTEPALSAPPGPAIDAGGPTPALRDEIETSQL